LLVDTCSHEAEQAIKYEGARVALPGSFEYFGGSTIEGLMSQDDVGKFMSKLQSSMDKNALTEAFSKYVAPVKTQTTK